MPTGCSTPSAFETQQTVLSIDNVEGELVWAPPCHFVPSCEEVAYALINVSVNAAECRSARPMAEVVRPAKQRAVQRVAHFRPWIVVARHQQIADLRLEPLHTLLGRARAQIPMTVRFVTVRSERIAEEVEALLPSILQRGLRLVECQPEPRHHRLRPCQGLGRTSATEDDEVIGIRDDACPKRLPAPGQPPILQEPIHVDVGEQWAHDAALWRAARVAFATTDAPGPVAIIPLLDRRFQPQLDQPEHVPVHNATSY